MAERITRRKIAAHVASELVAGNKAIIDQLAGFIVATGRQREAQLIMRDIEDALAERGIVIATATTAHGLNSDLTAAIKRMVSGQTVIIREQTDPSLISGLLLQTPGRRYDGTIRHRINELRAQKV